MLNYDWFYKSLVPRSMFCLIVPVSIEAICLAILISKAATETHKTLLEGRTTHKTEIGFEFLKHKISNLILTHVEPGFLCYLVEKLSPSKNVDQPVHTWSSTLKCSLSVFVLGVKQACCEFLESQLDPSNCLGIRDFAETHNCVDLMQAAEVFSQKHFPEVVQHEEFILLSQGEVEKLIKCDEIQVQIWLGIGVSSRLEHYKT